MQRPCSLDAASTHSLEFAEAHFSGRPPVSMPLEALLPKGSPKSTKPGQKEVDPQAEQEIQQGNGPGWLHPPVALVAETYADG
ncbi:unnamed protein product [Cladocopium goreaui]|uniref:Uncharacterized protein n=1 Tax=Cladocopium goreaui TaxID=2562237 RepID=A0A9P1FRM1_9DINO|nr:unnamed protein product [Cladocopium goreaui]